MQTTPASNASMVGFVSPRTGAPLRQDGEALVSPMGERVPIVRSIPRFVPSDGYTAAFGLQWNLHSQTQLDSRTGAHLSRERLERSLGVPLAEIAGLRVLEAGCGAGTSATRRTTCWRRPTFVTCPFRRSPSTSSSAWACSSTPHRRKPALPRCGAWWHRVAGWSSTTMDGRCPG